MGHFSKMCRTPKFSNKKKFECPNRNFKHRTTASKKQNFIECFNDSPASILTINDKQVQADYFTEVYINGHRIRMIIDTGAQVSVLKYEIAARLNLEIHSCNKTLFSYDGNSLNLKGVSNVSTKWNGVEKKVISYYKIKFILRWFTWARCLEDI